MVERSSLELRPNFVLVFALTVALHSWYLPRFEGLGLMAVGIYKVIWRFHRNSGNTK